MRATRRDRRRPVGFGWLIVLGRTVRRRRIGPVPGTGPLLCRRCNAWGTKARGIGCALAPGCPPRHSPGIRLGLRRSTCRPCDRRVRGRSGLPAGHTCGWSTRLRQRRRAERGRHRRWNRRLGEVVAPGRMAASSARASSHRAKPSPQVESPAWARSPRRAELSRQENARRRAVQSRHCRETAAWARSPRRAEWPHQAHARRRTEQSRHRRGSRPLGKVATPGRMAASSARASSHRAKPSPQGKPPPGQGRHAGPNGRVRQRRGSFADRASSRV